MSVSTWTHDGLQADLAKHLSATRDRVVWEDMQLGPVGSPRPDVYTVPKSYAQFRPLAYEIKISVADFRRDVTSGKWQKYLEFASGVTFAVPSGLIGKGDIPLGTGLMVRGEEGWKTVKAPTLKHVDTLPRAVWLKLIIDGIERQRKAIDPRGVNPYRVQKELTKKFGEKIAAMVCEVAGLEDRLAAELQAARCRQDHALEMERERYERELARRTSDRASIDEELANLRTVLGLGPNESTWKIVSALQKARESISRDDEIARLKRVIDRVRSFVVEAA